MKKYFILAAAALAFAACTSDEIVPLEQAQQTAEENAVTFDVYTQRGVTRGGVTGPVTTELLKQTTPSASALNVAGFGVFGYYTDNNDYDQRNTPNFFYNQQVNWDGTSFSYAPIKYWPNEYGTNATSDDADKVTYFAYAPWVDVVATSGKLKDTSGGKETWGITGMTRNNNQGDPILKYIGSFDSQYSVDLCWGVIDNGDTNWDIVQTGNVQTPALEAGKPWLNVYRPAGVDQKVRFTFKHATAQMKVVIDADVDETNKAHAEDVNNKTRVWVRQVTFNGFAMKGSLNLNNEDAFKPLWLDYNGQNDIVSEDLVVYDGRKDGKEGVKGAVASNEKSVGLNPTLVQDGVYSQTGGEDVYDKAATIAVYDGETGTIERKGVTNQAVNLFNSTGDLFYVIPNDDNLEIEIVYDIETVDGNLSTNLGDGQTKGSNIENRISQKISIAGSEVKLQAGHSYTINLHLGMNSVKFDAAVGDWIEETAQDVDLPANAPKFTAGTTYAPIKLPYTGNYTFAITGLDGGESTVATDVQNVVKYGSVVVTPSVEFTGWGKTANNALPSGVAVQTVTTAPNPNTTDREQEYKWTGQQSGKEMDLRFTQAAHPLFMKVYAVASSTRIILYRYNDPAQTANTDWDTKSGWLCDTNGKALTVNGDPDNTTNPTNGIAVFRNGTELVWQDGDTPTGNHFQFTNAGTKASSAFAATIEFGDPLKKGDVIKVILKTGDAPVETVTTTVPNL